MVNTTDKTATDTTAPTTAPAPAPATTPAPAPTTRFHKYHALGNDYLVLDPKDWSPAVAPTPEQIRKICHRHYGLASDGILWGPFSTATTASTATPSTSSTPSTPSTASTAPTPFGLRIFNPDGSEAEKSGNGLRIFSRYLYDQKLVAAAVPFHISTPGGVVLSTVYLGGESVRVEMGHVSFDSAKIPVLLAGVPREVLGENITVNGRDFLYCAATVGNPHCVIPVAKATAALATEYGPAIENHPLFPNRTNVQFLEIIDRKNIRIEIWERGAGYTYASGSSSSAAAAVARKLDLADNELTVHMPGGKIEISIAPDYAITMTGPVTRVGEYQMSPDVLSQNLPSQEATPQ
ncbi:MAG: diaminopimelate epimerase [Puniceicoccales bacterium]|jgi:diaminopimelate epimerase|nr:diaminopimelate epimerase [Puniceicoccales bacterium]